MPKIAYLCTDLLFTSKIRETAIGLGLEVAGARDLSGLPAAARAAGLVVIDLRRDDALIALQRLRTDDATRDVPTVGFCDHERVELMADARAKGCTHVYAKGRFSSSLGEILDLAKAPLSSSAV